MKSKEIKLVQAQLEVIEKEAILLAKEVYTLIKTAYYFEEIVKDGVIVSYFACGAQDNVLVPWIAFDEGLEAWQAEIEEDRKINEEKFRLLNETQEKNRKKARYQEYLKLKEEFEGELTE
jgi:hypothetical protein